MMFADDDAKRVIQLLETLIKEVISLRDALSKPPAAGSNKDAAWILDLYREGAMNLTDWEKNFLSYCATQSVGLSENQETRLRDLVTRTSIITGKNPS